MKYFFDTEFIEDGKTIDLISIGIVRADGRELYLESAEAALERANPWVVENVLPHLGPVEARVSRAAMRRALLEFTAAEREAAQWLLEGDAVVQFVGYYADYDWVALCQLFGCMIDLPVGWRQFSLDLRQLSFHMGIDIQQPAGAHHHALEDARWIRRAWQAVEYVHLNEDAR